VDTVQSQAEMSQVFLDKIYGPPEGEKVKLCIQCGTCSGSCPTSAYMDYTPREIIASLRAGMLERVLKSNTMWMCTSCYSCTVRCPAGIRFTDVMYELKRLAVEHGYYSRFNRAPALSKSFMNIVGRYGRSAEAELILRLNLGTNPLGLLQVAPMGLRMLTRRRMPMLPERIEGRDSLKKMLAWVEAHDDAKPAAQEAK
jgi:heterodisulfide reductase subunit C